MTTLDSGYSASHRAQVAEYNRMGYLANGWNKVRRWGGRTTTLETAGIAGPSDVTDSWTPSATTAAGACTPGFHTFRFRYQDSRTGYVSNPSEQREIEVISGAAQLTFSIGAADVTKIPPSTDTKVDKILLEMTVVGGSVFFLVSEALNTASTIVVSLADANLERRFLPWEDDGHDVPPVTKNILSHRERLWLYSQVTHSVGTASFTATSALVPVGSTAPDWITEALGSASGTATGTWFIQKSGDTVAYEIDYYDLGNTRLVLKSAYAGSTLANANYTIFNRITAIWVSNPGYPEGFTPLDFLNSPNGEGAGDVTAGVGYGSSVIFFTQNAMFKFAWDQDPKTDGFYAPLSSKYGALNQRVVIEVEGVVYSMDRRGWTSWTGVFPKLISRAVDPLRSLIDFDMADNFHCVYLPETRAIRWFVCYTGDTYPKNYVQLDIDTGAWSTGSYLQGISDSRLVPTSDGLRVLYGDENGHTWFADTGVCDGCPSTYGHVTLATTNPATTTTAVHVTQTLPTTGVGLAGCYLQRRLSTGAVEARLISSNTSSVITCAAFSTTPAPPATVTSSATRILTIAKSYPAATITASGAAPGSFVTDGYYAGMVITVASPLNPGTFTIAAVTATVITLLSTDVVVAEGPLTTGETINGAVVLWVGPITTKLKTKAFHGQNIRDKKRTNYLTVLFKPTSAIRYLQARVYTDLSATAKTWSALQRQTLPALTFPGVNPLYPTSDWLIDLSTSVGVAKIPLGGPEWCRHFEVELETTEPDSDFKILAFEYDGEDKEAPL